VLCYATLQGLVVVLAIIIVMSMRAFLLVFFLAVNARLENEERKTGWLILIRKVSGKGTGSYLIFRRMNFMKRLVRVLAKMAILN
jgi:hypothetical protein